MAFGSFIQCFQFFFSWSSSYVKINPALLQEILAFLLIISFSHNLIPLNCWWSSHNMIPYLHCRLSFHNLMNSLVASPLRALPLLDQKFGFQGFYIELCLSFSSPKSSGFTSQRAVVFMLFDYSDLGNLSVLLRMYLLARDVLSIYLQPKEDISDKFICGAWLAFKNLNILFSVDGKLQKGWEIEWLSLFKFVMLMQVTLMRKDSKKQIFQVNF